MAVNAKIEDLTIRAATIVGEHVAMKQGTARPMNAHQMAALGAEKLRTSNTIELTTLAQELAERGDPDAAYCAIAIYACVGITAVAMPVQAS